MRGSQGVGGGAHTAGREDFGWEEEMEADVDEYDVADSAGVLFVCVC